VFRAARLMWAAPGTVAGLLLAPFFRTRRRYGGLLICEGAAWLPRLGWRFRAITLGHVILSVGDLDERTLRHELVHVRQYERWGPVMVPAYLVACLVAQVRGGHYYRDNAFERAARAQAGVVAARREG
jgi:hypothetical protein